jgi:hypothetical protein
MAPAAWARSVDTELAIEIMKEHERADLTSSRVTTRTEQ